jgi:DNA replication protein DnaC
MNEDLIKKLKYLRLGGLLSNWDHYMGNAKKGNFSPVGFLKYIIEEEYKFRSEKSRERRLKKADIPEHWVIETYPFDKQPKLNKKKILNLYDSFDYMTKCKNIILMGPTGIGKSGLGTSFIIHEINQGYNGRFIGFADLIEKLHKSEADHSEEKILKKFCSFGCLLIDELGYIQVEPAQVGLFFTLMHKRHKKKSTIITTNLGFSEWNSFLKNSQLTSALIDRLTAGSYVINMRECETIRPNPEVF